MITLFKHITLFRMSNLFLSVDIKLVNQLCRNQQYIVHPAGTALGLLYAKTHNLLTPITIHAIWNLGVLLLFTYYKVFVFLCGCISLLDLSLITTFSTVIILDLKDNQAFFITEELYMFNLCINC